VFGHKDILMKKVGSAAIGLQCFKKQLGPLLVSKKSSSLPSLRGDKVYLA